MTPSVRAEVSKKMLFSPTAIATSGKTKKCLFKNDRNNEATISATVKKPKYDSLRNAMNALKSESHRRSSADSAGAKEQQAATLEKNEGVNKLTAP